MLDEKEGHPGVGRQRGEELAEGLESAGGRTDADDRKGTMPFLATDGAPRVLLGNETLFRDDLGLL